MFKRFPPFWHSRPVHSRSVAPRLVVVSLLPEVADALGVTVKTCQLRSGSFLYYRVCAANGSVRHPLGALGTPLLALRSPSLKTVRAE